MSLMAHGWAPISVDTFDRMVAIALDFLGLDEDELPELPQLPEP